MKILLQYDQPVSQRVRGTNVMNEKNCSKSRCVGVGQMTNIKIIRVLCLFHCLHCVHFTSRCLCYCLIVLFLQHLNRDIYKCFIVIVVNANTVFFVPLLLHGKKVFLLVFPFLLRNAAVIIHPACFTFFFMVFIQNSSFYCGTTPL